MGINMKICRVVTEFWKRFMHAYFALLIKLPYTVFILYFVLLLLAHVWIMMLQRADITFIIYQYPRYFRSDCQIYQPAFYWKEISYWAKSCRFEWRKVNSLNHMTVLSNTPCTCLSQRLTESIIETEFNVLFLAWECHSSFLLFVP